MGLKENLETILKSKQEGIGWDVVIISASSESNARFWQSRFETFKEAILPKSSKVLTVVEDFENNGAGNGLGTLYAWKKAVRLAKDENWDLEERLKKGGSIALFHTAGLGSRMYPLTAAENGIKPAIRLPGLLNSQNHEDLMTLLEAIIKQTSVFAKINKGRLSVFWGDQLFIPSNALNLSRGSAIELFTIFTPVPKSSDWALLGFDRYGFIALHQNQAKALFEKCSFETYLEVLQDETLEITESAKSLGSFTFSIKALEIFLEEFQEELLSKKAKFETDTDFWMPLLLSEKSYLHILQKKGALKESSIKHFGRMRLLKEKLLKDHSQNELFHAIDVGFDSYWWDYGTLQNYYENNMKLISSDDEGAAMRLFFGLEIDSKNQSCCSSFELGERPVIQNSVVVGVKAKNLQLTNSLVVGGEYGNLKAEKALAYRCFLKEDLELKKGDVITTVCFDEKNETAAFSLKNDPRNTWNLRFGQNLHSFDEMSKEFLRRPQYSQKKWG